VSGCLLTDDVLRKLTAVLTMYPDRGPANMNILDLSGECALCSVQYRHEVEFLCMLSILL